METEVQEKIRITSTGRGSENSISLTGFSKENLEKMIASMTAGTLYVRVEEGKLFSIPAKEELPKPAEDASMLPFWRRHTGATQPEMFDEYQHSKEKGYSQSISIQHLCGYNYTPERYAETAEKLESYGFECLRSRRGSDAKFWEIWFLPGLWCAKGDLATEIKRGKNDEEKLRVALEFLRHRVSFGTLDVSNQRMCMLMEGD